MKSNRYITAMVGLLLMLGASTTTYGQIVKGKVFGGGQLAQVNGGATTQAACNVTINSGAVYGQVYGAGEGVKKDDTSFAEGDRPNVAKVTGDTKVTMGPGRGGGGTAWQDVFGGGALAKVEGDTYVSMSGGHIAANLFGGGMGDIKMNGAAYDRTSGSLSITFADVTGNTNVDITGGDIIWDRTSVSESSSSTITTYTYTKTGGSEIYSTTSSTTVDAIRTQYEGEGYSAVTVVVGSPASETVNGVTTYFYNVSYASTDVKVFVGSKPANDQALRDDGYILSEHSEERGVASGDIVYWDVKKKQEGGGKTYNNSNDLIEVNGVKYAYNRFYNDTDNRFIIKHNIFGGGYVACRVGTYDSSGNIQNKKDEFNNDLTDDDNNVIPTGRARVSMVSGLFGADLMGTEQWKEAYNDNQDPHFYVFGGGFGAYTSVGKTQVQIGVDEEILEAAGENDEQWAKPMRPGFSGNVVDDDNYTARAKSVRKTAAGPHAGDIDINIPIADDSYGEPGYTILGVLGGGYAGIVTGNTDVRVGGSTFMHRIYGGGYGQLAAYNELKAEDNICAGIPTLTKTREDLGMVMGNTYVKTEGGFIQGDVFGGGAGVEWDRSADHDFVMGEVKGATEVEIGGNTFVLRSVYGGGDVANVLGGTVGVGDDAPQQTSTVTVKSGTVIQNVFGGGSGRLVTAVQSVTDHAVSVGMIKGNTLVTIENTTDEETGEFVSAPIVYGGIYGGGAYGQIVKTTNEAADGNTFVMINGGKIGGDIYGGGLGKVDGENITSANIAGATNVTVNGGSYLWDVVVDANGNEATWETYIDDFGKEHSYKEVIINKSIAEALANPAEYLLKATNIFDSQELLFKNKATGVYTDHNIYGGGNTACVSGAATVTINHGMFEDNLGYFADEKTCTPGGLLRFMVHSNKQHPQFSVLGGGYGQNTTVASTDVKLQMGKDNVDGYDNTSDNAVYAAFMEKLDDDFQALGEDVQNELYGGTNGPNVQNRYVTSRLAWSYGIPNHSVLTVAGGGMAGYVTGNTSVTLSDHAEAVLVFGGGIGLEPKPGESATGKETYGQVGGNTNVTVSGGVVSNNIYGGGAGIESVKVSEHNVVLSKDDDTDGTANYVDFVDIARVLGKTSVTITGSTPETLVYGAVYGGGDVANVGISAVGEITAVTAKQQPKNTEDPAQRNSELIFTTPQSTVTISGGCVFGEIFGGGSGRTIDMCRVNENEDEDENSVVNNKYGYKNVGAVYGNSRVIITEPVSATNATKPWLWSRIYGGGSYGKIYGNTDVQIKGGNVGYDIYGAGVGMVASKVVNDAEVTVLTSADVTGNANVTVTGGEFCLSQMWNTTMRAWVPTNKKDGKEYSAQYDPELKKFNIHHNIYAGSHDCGKVFGNTYLTMKKGLLNAMTSLGHEYSSDNIFAESEWKEIYEKIGSPHFCVFGAGYGENTTVAGDTKVDVNFNFSGSVPYDSEKIETAVNASKGDAEEQTYKLFESFQTVMDIIGGGYSGKVLGKTDVEIGGNTFIRRAFGGSFYAPVGQTNITIHSVSADDVFGGGMMGDVTKVTGTALADNACGNVNLRIGTPGVAANDSIFINNNVYGGNDVSGEVTGKITASIFGGKIYNNVYGAGNGNYLYALNDKVQKVTTHEYYEANGQTYDLVYEVPLRAEMEFNVKSATDAQKIVDINTYRPMAENVVLNISGTESKPLTIVGNIFAGGNTATVSTLNAEHRPSVTMNIGSYCTIGGVYMGADGEAMFQEKSGFMGAFQNINGVDLSNSIDWLNNPWNRSIGEQFLPVSKENRPKIYPHVLDLYFQPVEMSVQPTLNWVGSIAADGTTMGDASALVKDTIGTFVCGGNRGNMNVEPWDGSTPNYGGNVTLAGQIVNYSFPAGLTIQDRIVGGCNNANYTLGKVTHEGGYLLGGRKQAGKEINLLVECEFAPQATETLVAAAKGNNDKIAELSSGNVFGGCYKAGTIVGDVSIDLRSDMLKNVSAEVLAASKANNVPVASVYGAGYGMESYVYGATEVLFGKGTKSSVQDSSPSKSGRATGGGGGSTTIVYGSSAKDVYGGGQQGNLIGNSTIKVLNGHVAGSVVGGSYAGFMWGSTQVLVGYPEYYIVNKSGTYSLKRADKWNTGDDYKNADGSDAVKQTIKLIEGDIIAEEVFDAINAYDASQTSAGQFTVHNMAPAGDSGSDIKWDDINIKIDDAAYGGGYSLASGSSVGSQTYTVLKYNEVHNLDADMTSDKLTAMGGSSRGYGGNTTVLVWDHASDSYADGSTSDKEHIAISTQEMTPVTSLNEGDDLFGLYYFDNGTNSYKYIFQEGKYKYGTGSETGVTYYQSAFKYEGDGGVYGDGHLSFAEGFRAGEVNGYGFAGSKPNGAKILNTFQRMDMLRVSDCSLVLLGACDYTVNEVSTTPYSIARVGELQMRSQNVVTDGTTLYGTDTNRSRNFVGLSNNIHYVGAVTSDVPFTETFHKNDGTVGTRTYRAEKQDYVDKFYGKGNYDSSNEAYQQKGIFQKRNDGTAKNMIGIASGYAMKIMNTKTTDNKGGETAFYGPVIGVVEIALTNTHAYEAGAYVYAANLHHRDGADVPESYKDPEDFLETTGNFVFPYNPVENRYVIDDCYKTEYDVQTDKTNGEPNSNQAEAHYWFVAGWDYYFNAHITGYTYNTSNTFHAENDGSMTLVGTIAGKEVKVESIKWRSLHANAVGFEDELEVRNTKAASTDGNVDADGNDVAGKYKLYIGTSAEKKFASDKVGAFVGTIVGDVKTPNSLAFTTNTTPVPMVGRTVGAEDNILIALQDDADNHGKDYFNAHFAEPCEATIVLSAPAYEADGNTPKHKYVMDDDGTYYFDDKAGEYKLIAGSGVDMNGKSKYKQAEGRYTYTIYLTIDYVMGPTYTGNILVENCALPGEMVKVSLGDLTIESDPSMPTFGYNWKFGPRTKVDDKWVMTTSDPSKVYTYKVGAPFDPDADSNETSEMLAGVKYNKDGNYIEVPAYYFMNGYGVEYNFNVTGINENGNPKNFAVAMRDQDQLTIHNYHRMKPRNADGVNKANVDFHLDLAAERAASDPNFAEPRIYIADAADLNEFARFLEEKKDKDSAEGSKYNYGKNMQFHLLNNVTLRMTQEDHYGELDNKKGTAAHGFKGTLNGNGYVIDGFGKKTGDFTAPLYLFDNTAAANFKTSETVDYNIYNLGVVEGKIMSGDDGSDNANYHCSYSWTDGVVYRQDGTAVGTTTDGAGNTYTYNDWRYGKVAYDLNEYYLDHRKGPQPISDPHHLLAKSPKLNIRSGAHDDYVKNLYSNGDYLYARWMKDSEEFLRTNASQYDANYNSTETYHRFSLDDETKHLTHPVDECRAVNGGEPAELDHYEPLFEETSVGNTGEDGKKTRNDYLFFGQLLNSGTATALTGTVNITLPDHITTDKTHDTDVHLMTNRVYRADGYYASENAYGTSGNAFFHNAAAYVHDNGITAIDFKGYRTPDYGSYDSEVDYKMISLDRNANVTRNLLVYANSAADVAESTKETPAGVLRRYVYDAKTAEADVKIHVITPKADQSGEVKAETTYLHLVERTGNNKDASGAVCVNNDFAAPIAFNVTDSTWYTRQPAYYANNNNDAWEGICLPFTATKVVASLNGEITHFYGTPANDTEPIADVNTLHHEYWLRGLTAVATADGVTTATYKRPGDGLFSPAGLGNVANYTFNNQWFTETYGTKNYNSTEPQNQWYTAEHTYTNYKPLTAGIPFIVSFPGERFYEFDLSSRFYNNKTGGSEKPQTVTFSNGNVVTINVTNQSAMQTTADGYKHNGVYLSKSNADGEYYINSNGTKFEDSFDGVLPFRTYMSAASSPAKRGARPMVISIGGTSETVMPVDIDNDDNDPGNGDVASHRMVAYSINHNIIIESDYSADVEIYTAAGQLSRAVRVCEGSNLYTGFAPGVYIINGKKLFVK